MTGMVMMQSNTWMGKLQNQLKLYTIHHIDLCQLQPVACPRLGLLAC